MSALYQDERWALTMGMIPMMLPHPTRDDRQVAP